MSHRSPDCFDIERLFEPMLRRTPTLQRNSFLHAFIVSARLFLKTLRALAEAQGKTSLSGYLRVAHASSPFRNLNQEIVFSKHFSLFEIDVLHQPRLQPFNPCLQAIAHPIGLLIRVCWIIEVHPVDPEII